MNAQALGPHTTLRANMRVTPPLNHHHRLGTSHLSLDTDTQDVNGHFFRSQLAWKMGKTF